ncbi:hypothetical protein CFR73_15875 [Novacetimonas maltaceti]|nr:hypothetical protein CFR73_15875 [Novacetimonas maltaceti]
MQIGCDRQAFTVVALYHAAGAADPLLVLLLECRGDFVGFKRKYAVVSGIFKAKQACVNDTLLQR